MRRALLTSAILLCCAAAGQAVQFPPKPPTSDYFVDQAGLIAPAEREEINRIAASLLVGEDVPIIVVTIQSLQSYGAAGYTIERYARELFDHWGIGSKDRNYGMLLLVSKGDRQARIELGAAWGRSHDDQAAEVMQTLIIPAFKKGEFSEGILAGVRGMDALARGLALPKPERPWWVPFVFLGVVALIIGVIVSLFRSGRKGWGWALIALLGIVLFFIIRNALQNRGSGGAFGGGFSGGGGATGSW